MPSGGAVERRVAGGQHSEVVTMHMDGMVLQVVAVYEIVVDEHHLDGFVVREVDRVCALAAVGIAIVVVAWFNVVLSK